MAFGRAARTRVTASVGTAPSSTSRQAATIPARPSPPRQCSPGHAGWQVRLPGGKLVDDYHCVEMPAYTVIFAETEEGQVIVERQYKHGLRKVSLTLPAGLVEAGEDTLVAAQRELLEETGYQATGWRHLGSFVPNSNYGCGLAHVYRATRARRVAEPDAGDLEEIEILLMSPDDLLRAVQTGEVGASSMALAVALATHPRWAHPPAALEKSGGNIPTP